METGVLIAKTKRAYEIVGRVPSRSVKRADDWHYASAAHVLAKCCELHKHGGGEETEFSFYESVTPDWLSGFTQGFEWTEGKPRLEELLRGFMQGLEVAEAVFAWDEAPNFVNHVGLMNIRKMEEEVEYLRREVKRLHAIVDGKPWGGA